MKTLAVLCAKNIPLILLFIAMAGVAQENPTIKLTQQIVHIDENPTFFASIVITPSHVGSSVDTLGLDKMILSYKKELDKKGIPFVDLKENPVAYTNLGYEKEGVLYMYRTTSVKDFYTFLSIKSLGLYKLDFGYKIIITPETEAILTNKAIHVAKERAEAIVKRTNKRLGDVQTIETSFTDAKVIQSIYGTQQLGRYVFDVTVDYKILD